MWKDTTSYSRDHARIPSAWSIDLDEMRVSITKGHIYNPGKWVMHCEPWFRAIPIANDTMTEADAKQFALKKVRSKLESAVAALNKLEQ